ncbi:phosphoglycerate mutase [Neokomagataea thailandica NBRC 106555]|uniref:Histidine phosphatase family protein n=2 Tax=Neokomagataea TaxID=1223423 RepID=A0A4Y6V7W5_9PROT|nr:MULTISPECIES: histidine phosphatase family protein [Neokomagataea]QDH25424.1 histidine phosphatase family protein [Neokomagataea tanensis]GBR50659.1 phosphoglycerate mutase [Neokomagataea thailandica NBRC 106555]
MSPITPRTFWYLRHGQTDWNVKALAQGHTDIPLNANGLEQAVQAGDFLATLFDNGQKPFDHIVASPLSRALTTAQYAQKAIFERHGITIPLNTDVGFKEVCFGILEGKEMGNWYEPWIYEGYKPEGAEGFSELTERSITATNRAFNGGTPLIVAHGALYRGLRAGMGLDINVRIPNATPMRMDHKDGTWDITVFPVHETTTPT